MNLLERFLKDDLRGIHYAVSIFIATTVLWILVKEIGDANPIWAISSMVATSDPQMKQAMQTFRGRIINTLLGCAVGLLSPGPGSFRMEAAVRDGGDGPALVVRRAHSDHVAAGTDHRRHRHRREPAASRQADRNRAGLRRVGEVLLGCVVGIAVAWLLSKAWPLPEPGAATAAPK